MGELILLNQLDSWLEASLVAGEFSISIKLGEKMKLDNILSSPSKAFDIVRLALPAQHPREHKGNSRWWSGWSTILLASGLLRPRVDPHTLNSLIGDRKRIRFCCDTNSLAGGAMIWLHTVLRGRMDIVTSAVVDRELAAWPDRNGRAMWRAKSANSWALRTQYRLARRSIERAPAGVVIDRLSPQQSALMLAKLRDESGSGKSPDADMLLIELARSLVRDQPQNARVLYVTGDRNNARSATGAMGPENVLYIAADQSDAKKIKDDVVTRGWWAPQGPLGTLRVPPISEFIWTLLAAGTELSIRSPKGTSVIAPHLRIPSGLPADWADPLLSVAHYPKEVPISVASNSLSPDLPQEDADSPTESSAATVRDTVEPDWLLAPRPISSLISDSSNSWVLSPKPFFQLLEDLLFSAEPPRLQAQGHVEILRAFQSLGWSNEDNRPTRLADEARLLWNTNDLDGLHAKLLGLNAYAIPTAEVRKGQTLAKLNRRARRTLGLGIALGQISDAGNGLSVGDSPLTVDELHKALVRWTTSGPLDVERLAANAIDELSVSVPRLNQAMSDLMKRRHIASRIRLGRGGTVGDAPIHDVVVLAPGSHSFRPTSASIMTFGGQTPVRTVEWRK